MSTSRHRRVYRVRGGPHPSGPNPDDTTPESIHKSVYSPLMTFAGQTAGHILPDGAGFTNPL